MAHWLGLGDLEWERKQEMKVVQYFVLRAIAAILITLCFAEVMRGEDPAMANKEAVTRDLRNLALRAQDFYRRPVSNGGGQGSFILLTCDPTGLARLASKSTSSNGTYSILTAGTATNVVIHGEGTAKGTDGNYVSVDMTVFADSTSVVYNN